MQLNGTVRVPMEKHCRFLFDSAVLVWEVDQENLDSFGKSGLSAMLRYSELEVPVQLVTC